MSDIADLADADQGEQDDDVQADGVPADRVPAGDQQDVHHQTVPAPVAPPHVDTPHTLDLDGIERDLADVEHALARLDAGTYWSDEVTGDVLPDDVLVEHPTARRLPQR